MLDIKVFISGMSQFNSLLKLKVPGNIFLSWIISFAFFLTSSKSSSRLMPVSAVIAPSCHISKLVLSNVICLSSV